MKIRWFAAGIAAVLITGGAATVAQRVITQKTRGVLPTRNDSAHADSRILAIPGPPASSPPIQNDVATSPPPLPLVSIIDPVGPEIEPTADPLTLVDASPPPPAIDEPAPIMLVTETIAETAAIVDAGPSLATVSEPPVTDPALEKAAESIDSNTSVTSRPAPALADPVETVESFVERNRQEAESNIQSLATEAENLKARLAKVEAALVRWRSFSRALHANQPADPDQASPTMSAPSQPDISPAPGKANWKRISEPTKRPDDSSRVAPAHEPIKEISASSVPSALIDEPSQESPPPTLPPASADSSPPAGLPPGDSSPPLMESKPTDLPPPAAESKPIDLPPPTAGPEPTDLPPSPAGPEPTDLPPPGGVAPPLPLS